MRCARPLTLSPVSWDVAIGLAFVVGLLLLGISASMLRTIRSSDHAGNGAQWPQLVDEELTGAGKSLRLDIVERLSLVDNGWSRGILERARTQERDPDVRAVIDKALST